MSRRRLYSIVSRKAIPLLKRFGSPIASYDFPQLINSDYAKRVGIYEKLNDPAFTGIGSTDDLPDDPLEAKKCISKESICGAQPVQVIVNFLFVILY